ncbi:MAG: MotA/TolQ/ExbB proton channel family protein [Bifidobacterium adolescentis]
MRLIRTITWAVPILGFLGTVIGITMAIANITPDQLESSLGEVTAGLAVAFDTTASVTGPVDGARLCDVRRGTAGTADSGCHRR